MRGFVRLARGLIDARDRRWPLSSDNHVVRTGGDGGAQSRPNPLGGSTVEIFGIEVADAAQRLAVSCNASGRQRRLGAKVALTRR